MKVALVHELLTMRGGAERVLRVLAEMFPEAPIYTLLYDEGKFRTWFPRERIRISSLQRFVRFSKNHHCYVPFFPGAVEAWDFSGYDLVISSSSAFAHGIITNSAPRHICYVHSPARYLWDRTHDVLDHAARGLLGPLRERFLHHVFHHLRIWDSEAADRPDVLLAASREVQRRIALFWRRESRVIHPPIDDFWLQDKSSSLPPTPSFLVVSTLAPYKRIDLAIHACNALKLPLKIAGEGPDLRRLKAIAGPTIEFLGFQDQTKLRALYAGATATIVPGEEDFGLVPLESMACATPVIAYRSGGVCETVLENFTGAFFADPDPQSLASVLETFDRSRLSADACKEQARTFSRKRFEQQIFATL